MKVPIKITMLLRIIIAITLFVYASTLVDWYSVRQILQESNIRLILLTFLMSFPLQIMKIYRWKILLCQKGVYIPFTKLLDYATRAGIYGSITPGRMGEFSKVYYLANENVSKNVTIQTIIYDRVLDILPMAILTIIMCQRINLVSFNQILIGIFVCCSILLLLLTTKFRYNFLKVLKTTNIYLTIVFILCFLVYVWFNYLLMTSIKIKINLLSASCLASTMGLVSIIPVSIAGIGTRDLLLIKLSSFLDISMESMISLSLMDLFFGIILPFLHRGSLVVLFYIVKFNKMEQKIPHKINNNKVE